MAIAEPVVEAPPRFPFSLPSGLEPPPEYARLREEQPVLRVTLPSGDTAWIATRYEDVRAVYTDPRFSRAAAARPGAPRLMPGVEASPDSIVSKDPPDHTRLRRLAAHAFTPRRIEALRPRVQAITDALLDAMEAAGPPADLVGGLAGPLAITVICELLGIPQGDRARFQAWSRTLFSTAPRAMEEVAAARGEMLGYLAALVQERRAAPTDDLLGVLIAARDQEDRLTESELISFAAGLLVAGYETTANRLANSVLTLLRHPDQLALLRREPERIAGAVEELLRFTPGGAAGGLMRVATSDVELGGATIRAGEGVVAVNVSANRDPAAFDDPDRLDLTRPASSHVTFGHGIHFCLGAQLARLELQVGIGSLLRRFPALRLGVPEAALEWRNAVVILSLAALPVSW